MASNTDLSKKALEVAGLVLNSTVQYINDYVNYMSATNATNAADSTIYPTTTTPCLNPSVDGDCYENSKAGEIITWTIVGIGGVFVLGSVAAGCSVVSGNYSKNRESGKGFCASLFTKAKTEEERSIL